ncbi:ubiquinol-cytochrome c reductase iron-sulfur subunit [Deinococcus taeanensis]|uniref:QcrA and Rieske domain-containing protein n=1 Tax=Deinococcus taeanensis TaxID=2737050 RepID=UPI001CDB8D5C|nr:ubiquinol-cytochrome c reductase iron-sulfur subunit [Deinococcus taeanensis]UBV42796.1 ubiquinol-cytochrome c reductase iron-sulfur subunit [Deinococcus taeanensis]
MTRYKKQDPELTRRKFINVAMGTGAAVGTLSLVSALGIAKPVFRLTADKAPPLKGDVLVHADAAKYGQPVKPSELSELAVIAYPMGRNKDGSTVIRAGEPNNQVGVYKFEPSALQAPTKIDATDNGIVVYSNTCTHAGCFPKSVNNQFIVNCPCHSGQYEPRQGCKVIGGPPPKPMPQLGVKVEGEQLVLTSSFLTSPYGYKNDEEWEAYLKQAEELLA